MLIDHWLTVLAMALIQTSGRGGDGYCESKCFVQEHSEIPWPVHECGPLDQERNILSA